MKVNRKSTKIAYWVLRVLALSSALLLFSVIGFVALQTVNSTSSVQAAQSDTATSVVTLSPADTGTTTPATSPTTVPTSPPVVIPTATPVPTKAPTPVPTKAPTKVPGVTPTAIPTTVIPITGATPTTTTNSGGAVPPPVTKGTPAAKPSPTPPGSPTPGATSTQVPTVPNGNTSTTKTQSSSGGFMATMKPLVWPIAGVGTTILFASAGLLGLMLWKKRTAEQSVTALLQLSSAQSSAPWMNQQAAASNGYYAQPTEATLAQNQTMVPSAMQGIAQYSPLLGAPDFSQLDAPVALPTSDFRPLPLDFPHILEVHTDKMQVPILPSTLQALSPEFQPVLQMASTPLSPMPGSLDTSSPSTPAQMPIPQAPKNTPIAYQFPQHDSSLENLMHQAQMGIFALPGKEFSR